MTFLWILLAALCVACWIYFGMATFCKGHYWMFWIEFFLPIAVDHRGADRTHQPSRGTRRH